MDILKKFYLRKNGQGEVIETEDEMYRRVAEHVAPDQLYAEEYYYLLKHHLFLPNSPTLMNAGTELGQLQACFVLPVEDSMENIFETVKHAALIQKSGGGVGFSFSNLRPAGDSVQSTGGVASGPIPFIEVLDSVANTVKQGGKRNGANMAILRVDHPDILDFIRAKTDSEDYLTNFNISVGLTDDFMEALESNSKFNFINPRTGEKAGGMQAQPLLDEIAEAAWNNGEPGIIFLDTIEKYNPAPHLGRLESTNPCLTGDMRLLTTDGYRTFEELARQTNAVELVNSAGEISMGYIWKVGVKPTVHIRLADGTILKSTPDHKFVTTAHKVVQAQNLKGHQLYPGNCPPTCLDSFFVKMGYICGDGQLTRLKSERHAGLEVNVGEKDYAILELFEADSYTMNKDQRRIYVTGYNDYLLKNLEVDPVTSPKRTLPNRYTDLTQQQKAGFLQGLFSANGSVTRGHRVSLKTASKELTEQLIHTLRHDFNIRANYTTNKPRAVKWSNGSYTSRISYNICIYHYQSLLLFAQRINFYQPRKQRALYQLLIHRSPIVTSVGEGKPAEVYDFHEPLTNWGVVEGFTAHNCGEQPLLPYEACVLGSVNLAKMVKDGEINWVKLNETVQLATRFLDDVLEVNEYPIPEVREASLRTRKIGLGVMGFAEMLIRLNVKYDSKQGLKIADRVAKFIKNTATGTSRQLAEERGAYPACEGKPIRNATRTTIAPTGSISYIAGTSGGIEPFYDLRYTREDTKEELVEFALDQELIDQADPEVLVGATDINPKWHVRMLAAWQAHVDNAVSKTINLPNSAARSDVIEAIKLAHNLGCKGVTVYRDGSRGRQVLSTNKIRTPKRTGALKGQTLKYNTGCGKILLTLNTDAEGNPTEVIINDDATGGCTVMTEAVGRLVSRSLRAGVAIEEIVSQLRKTHSCPTTMYRKGQNRDIEGRSCPDIIAKALNQGTELKVEGCPECGRELAFSEGCLSCPNCGYGGCN